MSLRARLLIVLGLLLATYVVAAVVVVSTQRDLLFDQVDQRLSSLSPAAFATLEQPAPPGSGELPPGNVLVAPTTPFTDLFIAAVDSSGRQVTLLAGTLPGEAPDIEAAIRAAGEDRTLVTVPALDGQTRYRALVLPQPDRVSWLVAAQPLAEIDAAIGRLQRTLWIAGGIIALVLALAYSWVQRLGLRPIARVTAIAEAITGGERARRVEVIDQATEAGKLGHAFNVMLDERDADEARLRQFVADASHELRTPLTSVRGYLELYRQGAFRESGQLDDVVRRLSAESTRMHGLVEDLLALASLDAGRPLRVETVDASQLLRDAAQDAQAVQPERPIEVRTPAEGPVIAGDEALLVQLVGILVANALAHTPPTTPVTLTASAGDGETVITVADCGPGLDPDAAARVFDRFWRGEESRARTSGGTGLGLAIARSITGAHGGTITLETAPGEGCTFTIRLPAVAPSTPSGPAPALTEELEKQ